MALTTPRKFLSQIGRNRMPVVQPVFGHHEFRVGIEHDKIRVASCGDSALARLASGQAARDLRPSTAQCRASVNPRWLASVHINGSAIERLAMPPQAVLKLPSSSRFIDGGQGEWSVATRSITPSREALPQSFAIFAAPNRRRALAQRRSVGDRFRRQMQIVRAGFDADGKSRGARSSQFVERAMRRQMHDVQTEADIPGIKTSSRRIADNSASSGRDCR